MRRTVFEDDERKENEEPQQPQQQRMNHLRLLRKPRGGHPHSMRPRRRHSPFGRKRKAEFRLSKISSPFGTFKLKNASFLQGYTFWFFTLIYCQCKKQHFLKFVPENWPLKQSLSLSLSPKLLFWNHNYFDVERYCSQGRGRNRQIGQRHTHTSWAFFDSWSLSLLYFSFILDLTFLMTISLLSLFLYTQTHTLREP